jgi:hypothetical protein
VHSSCAEKAIINLLGTKFEPIQIAHPLKNGNIVKRLPFIWKDITVYYENVHEWQTWKMEQNQKKISGIPFHFRKIAGNS